MSKDNNIIVEKPWGYYKVLLVNKEKKIKIKELIIYPNQKISFQRHFKREERWSVLEGVGIFSNDRESFKIFQNDVIVVPIEGWHTVENIGSDNLFIMEVQLGEFLEEDDIERKNDIYGRV